MIIDSAAHPLLGDAELARRLGSPWNRGMLPSLLGQRATPPFSLSAEPVERAGDPAVLAAHMAAHGIELAILTPPTRGLLPHTLAYRAMMEATNRWLVERWLESPEAPGRFAGSIRVPITDTPAALEEIERWAPDERFVQLAVGIRTPAPFGDERYFPIWEAAVRHGMPVYVHDDGPRANIEPLPTPAGSPSYFAEYQALAPFACIVQISSLITSGVFDRLPDLVFIFGSGGIDLARSMMWRLDKDWRAGRNEIPWVTEEPSSYLARHVRFVSQPEDGRPDGRTVDPEQLTVTEAESLVLFGSHFPLWDQVDPASDFTAWPEPARRRVLSANTLEVHPRLATALSAPRP